MLLLDTYFSSREVSVLEIAPNPSFTQYCNSISRVKYMSIDLYSDFAIQKMDVENMKFTAESFDVVVCYHTLDYVTDDKKAMREIFRVLKHKGVFISQESVDSFIMTEEWGKAVKAKQYRVRQYGTDFFQRLSQEGFFYFNVRLPGQSISTYCFKDRATGQFVESLLASDSLLEIAITTPDTTIS